MSIEWAGSDFAKIRSLLIEFQHMHFVAIDKYELQSIKQMTQSIVKSIFVTFSLKPLSAKPLSYSVVSSRSLHPFINQKTGLKKQFVNRL